MILKLKPALKDYLWGGTKLISDFKYETPLEKVAESWLLSCHKDGENIIVNGKYAGKTLSQVIETEGKKILGTSSEKYDNFPILIKLIDAKQDLSVQVHPDNEYALKNEGEYGKTECWYVLDCEDNAELIYGFKNKLTADEFRQKIKDNTFLDSVNKVKVHKGDFFFIEAGTLHAIGAGILLAEIQQNSNTTYRVFDYNRKDANGNTRPLHVEKAIDVAKCEKPQCGTKPSGDLIVKDGYSEQLLTKCDLFTVKNINVNNRVELTCDEKSFISLVVTNGSGYINNNEDTLEVKKGDSIFISAGSGKINVIGCVEIIETKV